MTNPAIVEICERHFRDGSRIARSFEAGIARLKEIEESCRDQGDREMIADLRNAFDIVRDLALREPGFRSPTRVSEAERLLLRASYAQPAKHSNLEARTISGAAEYPLAVIASLRGDFPAGTKHVLRCFLLSPRLARMAFLPELFAAAFKPHCTSLINSYEERITAVELKSFKWKVRLEHAAISGLRAVVIWFVVLVILGIVTAILLRIGEFSTATVTAIITFFARAGFKLAQKKLKSPELAQIEQKYRRSAVEDVKREMEIKIDERCRVLAQDFIVSGSASVRPWSGIIRAITKASFAG